MQHPKQLNPDEVEVMSPETIAAAKKIADEHRAGEHAAYPARYISYGKPLTIALFLPESPWGDIDDSAMNKGLGGRETALVALALEFAALGHDVYAFVPRKTVDIIEAKEGTGRVRWIPNEHTISVTHAVQPDMFISWENVEVLKQLTEYNGITAIEMQVAHLNSDVPVAEVADYIFVLSEWAKDFIRSKHDIEPHRVVVFPNGVKLSRFEYPELQLGVEEHPAKEDMHFVYSSSPDRGLHHLLKMWKQITEMIESTHGVTPTLHVCYGIENFVGHSRWSHREDGRRALDIEQLIEQPGIVYHGKVGQDELAEIQASCALMLYPCDTMSPTETGCISIVEALAAGTPVVTTDCDCIGPDYGDVTTQVPLPFTEDQYQNYIAAIIDTLNPVRYHTQAEKGLEFVKQRDWNVIAQSWIEFIIRVTQVGSVDEGRTESDKKLDAYYDAQMGITE